MDYALLMAFMNSAETIENSSPFKNVSINDKLYDSFIYESLNVEAKKRKRALWQLQTMRGQP